MRLKDTNKMTTAAIKEAARKIGYFHKTTGKCPVCGGACLKFNGKDKPYYYACVNGHRWEQAKWQPTDYVYCKECKRARVHKTEIEENDGYCWHCKPKGEAAPQPPAEKNVGHAPTPKLERKDRCKCGKPLPDGRKAYCYKCRPQKRQVVM